MLFLKNYIISTTKNWWENHKKFWLSACRFSLSLHEWAYVLFFFFYPFRVYVSSGFYLLAFASSFLFLYSLGSVHRIFGYGSPSFKERFKAVWDDPNYHNMTKFWSDNFRKNWIKQPLYNLLWQLPVFGLITFYLAFATRFYIGLVVFYFKTFVFVLFLHDPLSFVVLILYLVVIKLLKYLADSEAFKSHINQVYGEGSLKRLGWNSSRVVGSINTNAGIRAAGYVSLGTTLNFLVSPLYNLVVFNYENECLDIDIKTEEKNAELAKRRGANFERKTYTSPTLSTTRIININNVKEFAGSIKDVGDVASDFYAKWGKKIPPKI